MDVISVLRGLGAVLCNAIYPLIAILYDLFMKVSRVELLTSDYIQPIYQRVTMILAIVMVFYVTFEMVKFVVEPDNFSSKDKGAPKIVVRMILVVVLIAFVPKIFSIAYQIQNKIFDTQIFSKIILGKTEIETDQLGKNLSYNIFSMFYYVDDESFTAKELEEKANCDEMPCKQLVSINLYKFQQDGKFPMINSGLSSKGDWKDPTTGEKVEKHYIVFNWLFAVGVGGFIAYILLLYCIDVGVRVVQLLYLQIIAPIPIIAYLAPKKDGMFEKWTKQCVTTYLDLFIRTAIIYFILLMCEILGKGYTDGKFDSETLGGTPVFIVLVMGLLLFAHKMPKMLGELFPKMGAASGNFGLKAGERVAPEAARAMGAALGAKRLIGGAISRGVSRHVRNKANGAKSWLTKEGRDQAKERRQNRHTRNQLRDAYKNDTKDSQNIRKRVSDEMVAASKKNVKDKSEAFNKAKTELEAAKASKDQQRIAAAQKNYDLREKELKDEAKSYNQLMRQRNGISDNLANSKQEYAKSKHNLNQANQELEAAKASGDKNAIAQAQAKVDAAQADFNSKEQTFNQELENNKGSEIVQRWEEIKNTRDEMNQANAELQNARQSGDQNAINAAEAKYNTLAQKYTDQTESYKRITTSDSQTHQEMMNTLKAKLDDAESQVAEDNNTRYKSAIGAAAWGAVAGGVTGALGGAKATKLEDVVSKAKEGAQKDVKHIQELNKYIDNGGDARTIGGFVDRTMANIEKTIGVETAYVRRNLENQSLEKDIKEIDSSMSRADNVKKEFDATEDRIKSKLNDNKVKASSTKQYKTKGGTVFDVTAGTDYAQVSRDYKAAAKTANDVSDAAAKELQDKEAKISTITNDQRTKFDRYLAGENVGTFTQEEATNLSKYQEYKQAKDNADKKSKAAVQADRDATEVEKLMTRAIFTEMLNDPNFASNNNYDGVARQSLQRNYNEIKIANQDIELRTRVKTILEDAKNPAAYEAFINCRFKDYDQLDSVLVALNTARNDLSISKQSKQDQKRRNESSYATQADKAASDFNGSGK